MHREPQAANSPIEALRGRSAPLPIVIDEHGCIVAADQHFDTPFEFGVAFRHSEGDIFIEAEPGVGEGEGVEAADPRVPSTSRASRSCGRWA